MNTIVIKWLRNEHICNRRVKRVDILVIEWLLVIEGLKE